MHINHLWQCLAGRKCSVNCSKMKCQLKIKQVKFSLSGSIKAKSHLGRDVGGLMDRSELGSLMNLKGPSTPKVLYF